MQPLPVPPQQQPPMQAPTPQGPVPQGPAMGGPQQGMQGPQQMQQQPMPAPMMDQQDPAVAKQRAMDALIEDHNLAKKIKEEDLKKMGIDVVKGYEADRQTCKSWLDNNQEWLELALLVRKTRTFPWPGASNVKYPLLATAAMQFSARAYPTLVPADNNIVMSRVIGFDQDGSRSEKADRIAKHMSFQIMHRMPNWEEDMDRLLMMESIIGVMFKKTYKSVLLNTVVSELIYPENLIVNYWAKSLDEAYR